MADWAIYIGSTIAAIGATVGAVGSTVGAVEQHKQATANAEAQEAQARYNQKLEQNEQARIEAENAENARRQREAAEDLKARQRALLGKSGAAMSSGSPLAILGATALDQERQIQDTQYAGYRQAQQHGEQAKMYDYQARVAKASAPSKAALGAGIAGTWGNWGMSIGTIGLNTATALGKTGSGGKGK